MNKYFKVVCKKNTNFGAWFSRDSLRANMVEVNLIKDKIYDCYISNFDDKIYNIVISNTITAHLNLDEFEDIFYSKKELRQEKLNKIKNV